MAFAARLSDLTEQLIEAVTNLDPKNDARRLKRLREQSLRSFKSHSYLGTNHFQVRENLNGLEERFRVNHRETLADALRQRLDHLKVIPSSSKWHPEILFLILELSDQPTHKSRLSDLEAIKEPGYFEGDILRWQDIAKEDGWDEDPNLWKSINYAGSSDDDLSYAAASEDEDTSLTDSEEVAGKTAKDFVVAENGNIELFNAVRKAQEWRTAEPTTDAQGHARKIGVEELDVYREVLFMLQGLDTTLFDSKCAPVSSFQISHLKWETHKALITSFAEAGRQLRIMRKFVQRPQDAQHLQAFQDCISHRLSSLDDKFCELHARMASPRQHVVVSLVAMKDELSTWLEPLNTLSSIIARVEQTQAFHPSAFRHLELLYDEASTAQLSGKSRVYDFLARIFIECFNVYLRPVRLWMDEGMLMPGDQIFFVTESSEEVPEGDVWSRRFRLRYGKDGKIHAPAFLHPAVHKILNAGKNIVVLKRLARFTVTRSQLYSSEPALSYESMCPQGFALAPFSDLFSEAFDHWIQSKYQTTSITLKKILFEPKGLPSALQTLQRLYLMSDGSAASSFCEDVFARLDTFGPRWHDRYALTAIGHEAYNSVVDTSRLAISIGEQGKQHPTALARGSVRTALPHLTVDYRLPWSMQMIISSGSLAQYQAVLAMLLQFKRAAYILLNTKLLDNYWTDDERWGEQALYYSCRTNLVWFCTTVQTYLTTLVLVPNVLKLEEELSQAAGVDGLIEVHEAFAKRIVGEACLGSRLTPIREGMLDVLDLAMKLELRKGKDNYGDLLGEIRAAFEKNLRFICNGLRSVARAGGDASGAKWETLAEMLQAGVGSGAGGAHASYE